MPTAPTTRATPAGETVSTRVGSLQFIGNATTLIRACGFTILTDPNFLHAGDEAPLGFGLRSRRRFDPALDIEELPPLDMVVLSHLHGDHFDPVAERRLSKDLPIVTTPQAARLLRWKGFQETRPLRTWETQTFRRGEARARITALPAQHGPALMSKALPATMGSLLEFEPAPGAWRFRIYVSGDTLMHGALAEIPRRFPDVDLALVHLGGTRVFGVLVTMDDQQGVALLKLVAPRSAIPVHFDDYEIFTSPLADFRRAVDAAGWTDRVRYLERGESYSFDVPGA